MMNSRTFFSYSLFSVVLISVSQSGFAAAEFELSTGVEQDSNLNVVELDKTSNESDLALLLNAKANGSWRPAEKLTVSGGYSYSAKKYREQDEFDLAIHQLSTDANYEFDAVTLGASHHYAKAILAAEDFLDLHQTSLYIAKLINNRFYLRAAANLQDKSFTQDLSDRNAKNRGANADAFVFFNQGKSFVSLGVSSEKENAKASEFDYSGHSVKARASHKFMLGSKDQKVQLGYRYLERDYAGITAAINAERYDKAQVADASWEVSLSKNLSLEAKAETGKYTSNLASADYQDNRVSLQVKFRF
jgi:hypothetical protein